MNKENIMSPEISNLVSLPYQPEVYLCRKSKTRWTFEGGSLTRDSQGEAEWAKMAGYVGKTYEEVFDDSFKYAATRG